MLSGVKHNGNAVSPAIEAVPISAELRGILDKATAKTSSERYATVEAFQSDLQCWRDGKPVSALPNTAYYRFGKFLSRHRIGAVLATLATLALATFVWRLSVERDRAQAAETRARLALQQEQAAKRSAEQALRISEGNVSFFSDLLSRLMPDQTLGKAVSADELLAKAEQRAKALAAVAPEQAAILRGYAGSLAENLGLTKRAIENLSAAVDAIEKTPLKESLWLFDLRNKLADAYAQNESFDLAVGLYQSNAQALRSAAQRRPDQAPQMMALAELNQGRAYYWRSDLKRAREHLERAAAKFTALKDQDLSAESAIYLLDLADQEGDANAALAVIKNYQTAFNAASNPSQLVRWQLSSANAYVAAGDFHDAELQIENALTNYRNLYGSRGNLHFLLLNTAGNIARDKGSFAKARDLFEQANREYALMNKTPSGVASDDTVTYNIAITCLTQGDYDCSRSLLSDLHDRIETVPSLTQNNVSDQYVRQLSIDGEHDLADALMRRALEQSSADFDRAALHLNLARNAIFAKKYAIAAEEALKADGLF